jgi:hypothetical protein
MMARNSKSKTVRPRLAEEDRTYFEVNPEAGFRVRAWTPEDARCGTPAFDGYNLAGATVLVFRCGGRIPMMMVPATSLKWPIPPEAFARASIAVFPELAQNWP